MGDPGQVRTRASQAHRASVGEVCDGAIPKLTDAPDLDALVRVAVEYAVPERARFAPREEVPLLLGRSGLLYLLRKGTLELVAATGDLGEVADVYARVRASESVSPAQAVRLGKPVFIPADIGRDALLSVRGRSVGTAAYVILPLMTKAGRIGVLLIGFGCSLALTDEERERLERLADAVAERVPQLGVACEACTGTTDGVLEENSEDPLAASAYSARLDLAMGAAGAGTFEWDFATRTLDPDERACRLFGINPGEFDGSVEKFFAVIHPEDLPAVEAAVARSLETSGDYRAEYRVRLPGGRFRWIEARGRVLAGGDDRPLRMTGIIYDITEQRRRQERDRAEHEARRRREIVTLETTRALSRTLTVHDVIHATTTVLAPGVGAEGALVHLEDDGQLRLAGSTGCCDELGTLLRTIDRSQPSPLTASLETDTPMFYDDPDLFIAGISLDSSVLREHTWVVLPLIASGQPVGTCLFAHPREHRFSSDDRILGTAIGGLIAQAVARARLYDRDRQRMDELQRAMLPRRLPEIPGLTVAGHYLPGTEGLEIGGDWYDVLPLPSGRVALVIGDVQGHTVQAAALMGQLRIALLAYAAEGHEPDAVLARGNHLLGNLDTDLFATCAYAELDLTDGTGRIARAGHPQPVRVLPDGRAEEIEVPGGPPLGVLHQQSYPVTRFTLPPGATLVMYTDGLVERDDQDYDHAVTHLCELLSWWVGGDPATSGESRNGGRDAAQVLAEHIVNRAGEMAVRKDDIAVLLARRTVPQGSAPVRAVGWQVDSTDLREVSDARARLGRELLRWGLGERAYDAQLLAAELLSNAALHAGGELELSARVEEGVLHVEVVDSSAHQPKVPPDWETFQEAEAPHLAMAGRGVRVIESFSDRWGWEPLGERKVVWFELSVKDPEDDRENGRSGAVNGPGTHDRP